MDSTPRQAFSSRPPSQEKSGTSTSPSPTPVPAVHGSHSVRVLSLDAVKNKYPYFTPRNDWDLLFLSGGPYKGPPSGLGEYLDGCLSELQSGYPIERLLAEVTALLGSTCRCHRVLRSHTEPDDRKPRPGDPNVFIQAIPNSEYPTRLFPGAAGDAHYCLDFVQNGSGEPVNSPFPFCLFGVPDPHAPVVSGSVVGVQPLGRSLSREEKFVLKDGRSHVLRRPGYRDVRFTVPIRHRPKPTFQPVDADFL
ncbi:hypothetical protein BD413DRAFT_607573 [Trametes elegans]|nr:hypothetical protein BD413DRAFT_607573 [Trametes elegans]